MMLYQQRDIDDLEPHYSAHVSAMTAEGLHKKSAIAAELAYRDKEIERLRRVEKAARGLIDAYPYSLSPDTPYARKWVELKAALEEK